MEPLTGKDAVEAIGLACRLGNRDARFDRRRLGAALRDRSGRLRIAAGLTLAVRVLRFHGETPPAAKGSAARRGGRRSQRPSLALAAPDRPREQADADAYLRGSA